MLALGALAVGVHLMALLAGPAVIVLLWHEAASRPLPDAADRRGETAQLALFAVAWLLLIAIGLGSDLLLALAGAAVVVFAVVAVARRQTAFAGGTLAVVALGITCYLFLLLRARQGPWLNEADPSTWHALLAVIRRAQYPVRTPFDDPTVVHGAGNPGRTLTSSGTSSPTTGSTSIGSGRGRWDRSTRRRRCASQSRR